jgi:peroxin-6
MSHEGSPNDQVGLSSEVASVIREFTEPVSEDEDNYSGEKSNDYFVSCNFLVSLCSCCLI